MTCRICRRPLDTLAKAAQSRICSACAWEAGILRDGEEPPGMIITDLEAAGEGHQAA